ncbi:LPXTG cell wall anchor domain-containing protein [Kitasatospora sp. Root107]|nr:LPXTG cell wall anchor domain-containing protein [Kitasatospora sp. Root107]
MPGWSPTHGGGLPDTGTDLGPLLAVLAVALAGAGLLLALVARRGSSRHS